jgi:hypothetical protein
MAQGHLKKIIIYGTSCVIKENYKKNIIFLILFKKKITMFFKICFYLGSIVYFRYIICLSDVDNGKVI